MVRIFLKKASYVELSWYARGAFFLFVIWQIGIIIRDDSFSLWTLQRYIFTPGYLLYLAPFIVYKLANPSLIKRLLDEIVLLCKTFVIMIVPLSLYIIRAGTVDAINVFETLNLYMGAGSLFGLLVQEYLTIKQRRWLLVTAGIVVLLALILARRSLLLSYAIMILIYIGYKYRYRTKSFKSRFIFLLSVFSVLSVTFLFFYNYGGYFFETLFDRALVDTRTIVEVRFMDDVGIGTHDFIFGKGISGSYYCPEVEQETDVREHIESGYLELILKGGIVFVVLYLLFVLPAIVLGLFCSKNNFCRLAACYCVLFSISFYGIGSNFSFSIRYLILLFCVFICYKSRLRKLSNNQMLEVINYEK